MTGTLPNGGFCVGKNDVAPPTTGAATCGITSSPTTPANGEFLIHLAVVTEPTGVLQQLGDKARFGLLSSGSASDGGKVLVPIGPIRPPLMIWPRSPRILRIRRRWSRRSSRACPPRVPLLAETLYTGLRYIAQLPQPFTSVSYLYPCAFSTCGPSFQAGQTAGGIGPTEIGAPCQAAKTATSQSLRDTSLRPAGETLISLGAIPHRVGRALPNRCHVARPSSCF